MAPDFSQLYGPAVAFGPPPAAPGPESSLDYNFWQGLAAPETFPVDVIDRLCHQVITTGGPDVFEYFDPEAGEAEMVFGSRQLRRALAGWIADRQGVSVTEDQLIVTLGSAQGLALAAQTFVGPGDGVIVEETTFRCTLHYMRAAGATVATVPLDDDGLDVDALEARLQEFRRDGIRTKLVYTIPTFHLPTCTVLSEPRRRRLLELAEECDFLVLEDHVYAELRYAGRPVPSLLSLDTNHRVIQSDSFSKMIAPGIRLGWVAAHREPVAAMGAVRQDLGVSQFLCRVMAQFVEEGHLVGHLERANAVYLKKRDVAIAAMREHCAPWVTFGVPEGSFYLWVELAPGVDWAAVRQYCIDHSVYYRPGENFSIDGSSHQYLRLAFSYLPLADIETGISILGEALAKCSG